MNALTDEELEAVLVSRRQELVKKRQLLEDQAKSEKRLKLMKELDEINDELTETVPSHSAETTSSTETSSSNEISSSNASSSSSSATSVALPPPLAVAQPKLKNSMFAYWDVKTTSEAEMEVINAQRVKEAKSNSQSRESAHHNERNYLPRRKLLRRIWSELAALQLGQLLERS